ncbi:MAG: PA3496 family putative envelope integrity protein [Luminiphilus sp.]
MQGRDQDNSDMSLTDDVAETILSDFDEAALNEMEKITPNLSDSARLAEKRRRAEDLLERRRLREELGDDDFNFD